MIKNFKYVTDAGKQLSLTTETVVARLTNYDVLRLVSDITMALTQATSDYANANNFTKIHLSNDFDDDMGSLDVIDDYHRLANDHLAGFVSGQQFIEAYLDKFGSGDFWVAKIVTPFHPDFGVVTIYVTSEIIKIDGDAPIDVEAIIKRIVAGFERANTEYNLEV